MGVLSTSAAMNARAYCAKEVTMRPSPARPGGSRTVVGTERNRESQLPVKTYLFPRA